MWHSNCVNPVGMSHVAFFIAWKGRENNGSKRKSFSWRGAGRQTDAKVLDPLHHIPMAVVGIVMKFFQIVISIVVGMAAGCIPVVGFNMGAGKKGRVKELFTRLLISEATVGAIALIIVEVFPHYLINIFGAANESIYYTEFAILAFRIYLCMMVFACVNKACFIFLQAMGKALESTILSMVREIVFGVGFALLLPRFFGLDGVLYSMPLSDILTFAIAAVLIMKTYKELNEEADPEPAHNS